MGISTAKKIKRGRLRIYLGYANGCGKSFTLLKEAFELKHRKHQIGVAALSHCERLGIKDLAKEFQQIKFKNDLTVSEIVESDFDTVIIDELALTNPAGAKNKKRFEDVLEILESGKDVLTTVNIQHLDSVAERLHTALSLRIQERVPDDILNSADSVVFVDVSIDELQSRIQAEQVFSKDKAEQALFHFFTYENLCLLRKLALEATTEDQLRRIHRERMLGSHAREEADPCTLAVITDDEADEDLFNKMVHKAAKYASQLSSHFFVIMIHPGRLMKLRKVPEKSPLAERVKALAESLHGRFLEMNGSNLSAQIIEFCHSNHIRHLIFAKDQSRGFIQKAIDNTRGIDVHLIDRPSPRGER